jgi:K+-transporting ATPase KdpF subunit
MVFLNLDIFLMHTTQSLSVKPPSPIDNEYQHQYEGVHRMDLETAIAGLTALGLLVYLFYSLFYPERF